MKLYTLVIGIVATALVVGLFHATERFKPPRELTPRVALTLSSGRASQGLAFSPDGKTLAATTTGRTARVHIWDVTSSRSLAVVESESICCNGVAFTPDGKSLVFDACLEIERWDIAAGRARPETVRLDAATLALTVHPDGMSLAVGCIPSAAKVVSLATGETLATFLRHTGYVTAVAFSPDGRHVASGGVDETVRLWDAVTGKELAVCKGHTGKVASVAFSPDGRLLASAARFTDSTARLWDVSTGRQMRCLPVGILPNAVAFSPDGRTLATAATDAKAKLKLWDVATGRLRYQAGVGFAESVAFSPDGRTVAVGGDDTIHLFDVP